MYSRTRHELEEMSDSSAFEDLCNQLLSRISHPDLDPQGIQGRDGGKDSILQRDETTVFHYSLRSDWEQKLEEDLETVQERVDEGEFGCDKFVFVTNKMNISGEKKGKKKNEIERRFGWDFELIDGLRIQKELDSNHLDIRKRFFGITEDSARKTEDDIRESLLAEIYTHQFPPIEQPFIPSVWSDWFSAIRTTIFDSISDDIGRLSRDEKQLVVLYYSTLNFAEKFTVSEEESLQKLKGQYFDTYEMVYEILEGEKQVSTDDFKSLIDSYTSFKEMFEDTFNSESIGKIIAMAYILREVTRQKLKKQHSELTAENEIEIPDNVRSALEGIS